MSPQNSTAMELHGHPACKTGDHQHGEWEEVWCPECDELVYCPCECHEENAVSSYRYCRSGEDHASHEYTINWPTGAVTYMCRGHR